MQITKGKKPVCKGFTSHRSHCGHSGKGKLWGRHKDRGPPGPRGEGTGGAQTGPGTRDSSA